MIEAKSDNGNDYPFKKDFWYVATVAKHKSNDEVFRLSLLFLMMSKKKGENN